MNRELIPYDSISTISAESKVCWCIMFASGAATLRMRCNSCHCCSASCSSSVLGYVEVNMFKDYTYTTTCSFLPVSNMMNRSHRNRSLKDPQSQVSFALGVRSRSPSPSPPLELSRGIVFTGVRCFVYDCGNAEGSYHDLHKGIARNCSYQFGRNKRYRICMTDTCKII